MAKLTWRNWRKRSSMFSWGGGRRRSNSSKPEREQLRLELLEDRTLFAVSIVNNGGAGYAALHFSQTQGYVPPDTCGAAGPTNYVETVNQTLAIYNPKATGASATLDTFSHFWFTVGGLPHADGGSGLSDPIVTYDERIGRFIVGDQDVNFSTHVSRFDIAVSTTSSPATLTAADWKFYSIVTTETGYDADYPGNFGYNADAFVFTLNMFGSAGHTQVVSVNSADLAAGVASPGVFHNDVADFSLRPTAMHDGAAGGPMWLITEHGDNSTIDVIKMTNVLTSSATFAYTNVNVNNYTNEVTPKNPNGTTVTTNIDSRIGKAAERNNRVVASHSVGNGTLEDDAAWYEFDVSGATPTLMDQGHVSAGSKTYLTYPSIEINASNQLGMTYMKQGNDTSTDYVSMYVTGRNPTDAAGTMQTAVLVPSGTGVANYHDFTGSGRSGDLSGINVDPVDGSFWAVNEFANIDATANWGTAVANFTLGSTLPSTDMAVTVTGPSSVTAGTNAVYTITITNNGPATAQGVVLSDLMPTGSTFVSMSQSGGTDTFTFGMSGSTVTETASGNIASGNSDTFTLTVFAPSNLANGAPFNDMASVSASNPDPNTANNSATQNGTIVNSNPMSDLSVTVAGKTTAAEGAKVKYTITVKNNGPTDDTNVVLTDTLGSLFSFVTATTTQGTFGHVGNVVTFTIGNVSAGATVTCTVTGQALEDGSTSDMASVTGDNPDPNSANNSASKTTNFTEPAIVVSAPITTTQTTLTNFQVATFTHANGVEPTGDFLATIDWGDSTTSTGTITKVGKKYFVTGSHTYGTGGSHTITTTVVETGMAVDKVGDERPGQDITHLPFSGNGADASVVRAIGSTSGSSVHTTYVVLAAPAGNQQATALGSLGSTSATDRVFSGEANGHLLTHVASDARADWFANSWLNDIWA